MEVIVVDNASTDGSVEMVAQKYPQAVLLAGDQNLDFRPPTTGGGRGGRRHLLFLT
ncbi:MAG: hypothetical protein H6663_06475 [Candidatus Promineofilum sp.]|nr:hypothetical protein [Promineifilum sp.]